MTLMVKGTRASELRTRFWPTRLTYSVTMGSSMSFEERSTSWASCLPRPISRSREYRFMPLPTLRLPMASTSSLEFLGLTVSCCWTGWEVVGCCVCGLAVGCSLAGSSGGSGLCGRAKAGAAARALINVSFRACRRTDCISCTSAYPRVYTPKAPGRHLQCSIHYDDRRGGKVSYSQERRAILESRQSAEVAMERSGRREPRCSGLTSVYR